MGAHFRLLFLAIGLLCVASCASEPPKPYPGFDFANVTPFQVNVSQIEWMDITETTPAPYLPVTPEVALKRLMDARLRAVGSEDRLQIIVKRAQVVETPLNAATDKIKLFTSKPDMRYDALLEVELRLYGDRPIASAYTTLIAEHSAETTEKMNVAERDRVKARLVHSLIQHIDESLERVMYQYFDPYLIATPVY